METILIDPTHFYYYQSLGIPTLVSYVRKKGHKVIPKMIDREIHNYLFSKKELDKVFERIMQKRKILLEKDKELKQAIDKKALYYAEVCSLKKFGDNEHISFDWILENQEIIKGIIRKAYDNAEKYYTTSGKEGFIACTDKLKFGAWLISLAYFPTTFSIGLGISMRYSPQVIKDIMMAINDREENFLIDYYQKETVPWLVKEGAGLIGISMCHFSQFIPGFTLMNLIRQSGLSAHITVGGTAVTDVSKFLLRKNSLWDLFDSVVVGRGEYSLDALITYLEGEKGGGLDDVPNLIYKYNGEIKQSKVTRKFSIDDVVTPEFMEDRPYPFIPIETSVGCPYGRCAFCHYPFLQMEEWTDRPLCYQERSLDLVIDDIQKLNEKYKPLLFCFSDTSVPARRLEKIAEKIIERSLKISFWAFIRAEKDFLSLELCRKLAKAGFVGGHFGLESASQRMNDLMDKGIDVNDVRRILRNFKEAGIIANLFCIIGFPGETREEAYATRDFIIENRKYLTGEISLAPFYLQLDTRIMKNPGKYKIRSVDRGDDLKLDLDYEVSEGLSQKETLELLRQFYKELDLTYASLKFLSQVIDRKFPTQDNTKD